MSAIERPATDPPPEAAARDAASGGSFGAARDGALDAPADAGPGDGQPEVAQHAAAPSGARTDAESTAGSESEAVDGLIVRVYGVHKYFQRGSERVDVLNNLTLEVPEGEFLALMGPSGSGKTTLLNLIAGLDTPSEGEVWVGPHLISAMSESQLASWRTRHVGFVFQFYHLLPVLTAYENVELPLLLLPLTPRQRRQQVLTALELVGLSNRIRHRPGQLSGGQQQRVGIARAIVTDPTLIVADEPTGDLDSRSAEEILGLIGELKRTLGKTILLVTHDPRAAARADRILHLEKGRLVEATSP